MGGGTRWLLLFFWVAALSPFSNPNKNGASFEKLADDLAASLANSAASNEKNFQESALVELSKGYGGDVESVNVAEALVPEFSLIDWRNISEAQFKGAKPFYGELEKVLNRLTIALNQTLRERGYDSNVQLRVALVKTTMPNAFVYQQESPRPGKAINRAIVGMTTGYIHEYFGPDLNNISPETWETGWRSLIGTLAHEVAHIVGFVDGEEIKLGYFQRQKASQQIEMMTDIEGGVSILKRAGYPPDYMVTSSESDLRIVGPNQGRRLDKMADAAVSSHPENLVRARVSANALMADRFLRGLPSRTMATPQQLPTLAQAIAVPELYDAPLRVGVDEALNRLERILSNAHHISSWDWGNEVRAPFFFYYHLLMDQLEEINPRDFKEKYQSRYENLFRKILAEYYQYHVYEHFRLGSKKFNDRFHRFAAREDIWGRGGMWASGDLNQFVDDEIHRRLIEDPKEYKKRPAGDFRVMAHLVPSEAFLSASRVAMLDQSTRQKFIDNIPDYDVAWLVLDHPSAETKVKEIFGEVHREKMKGEEFSFVDRLDFLSRFKVGSSGSMKIYGAEALQPTDLTEVFMAHLLHRSTPYPIDWQELFKVLKISEEDAREIIRQGLQGHQDSPLLLANRPGWSGSFGFVSHPFTQSLMPDFYDYLKRQENDVERLLRLDQTDENSEKTPEQRQTEIAGAREKLSSWRHLLAVNSFERDREVRDSVMERTAEIFAQDLVAHDQEVEEAAARLRVTLERQPDAHKDGLSKMVWAEGDWQEGRGDNFLQDLVDRKGSSPHSWKTFLEEEKRWMESLLDSGNKNSPLAEYNRVRRISDWRERNQAEKQLKSDPEPRRRSVYNLIFGLRASYWTRNAYQAFVPAVFERQLEAIDTLLEQASESESRVTAAIDEERGRLALKRTKSIYIDEMRKFLSSGWFEAAEAIERLDSGPWSSDVALFERSFALALGEHHNFEAGAFSAYQALSHNLPSEFSVTMLEAIVEAPLAPEKKKAAVFRMLSLQSIRDEFFRSADEYSYLNLDYIPSIFREQLTALSSSEVEELLRLMDASYVGGVNENLVKITPFIENALHELNREVISNLSNPVDGDEIRRISRLSKYYANLTFRSTPDRAALEVAYSLRSDFLESLFSSPALSHAQKFALARHCFTSGAQLVGESRLGKMLVNFIGETPDGQQLRKIRDFLRNSSGEEHRRSRKKDKPMYLSNQLRFEMAKATVERFEALGCPGGGVRVSGCSAEKVAEYFAELSPKHSVAHDDYIESIVWRYQESDFDQLAKIGEQKILSRSAVTSSTMRALSAFAVFAEDMDSGTIRRLIDYVSLEVPGPMPPKLRAELTQLLPTRDFSGWWGSYKGRVVRRILTGRNPGDEGGDSRHVNLSDEELEGYYRERVNEFLTNIVVSIEEAANELNTITKAPVIDVLLHSSNDPILTTDENVAERAYQSGLFGSNPKEENKAYRIFRAYASSVPPSEIKGSLAFMLANVSQGATVDWKSIFEVFGVVGKKAGQDGDIFGLVSVPEIKDRARPLTREEILRQLSRHLRVPVEKIKLQRILGSASIKTVVEVKIGGRTYAIGLRNPNAIDQVNTQLEFAERFVQNLVNEGLIEESNLLSELIRQQRTVIDRELDFRIEAGNHRRMLGVYKNYSRNRLQEWVQSRRFLSRDPSGGNERLELDWSIRPPKIHGTYVNRSPENVLMTEVVEGVAFDKFPDSLDAAKALSSDQRIQIKEMAGQLIADSYLDTFLRTGYLEPNPHVGNYLVNLEIVEQRAVVSVHPIDFGQTLHFSRAERRHLLKFFDAIRSNVSARGQSREAAKNLFEISRELSGVRVVDAHSENEFIEAIRKHYNGLEGDLFSPENLNALMDLLGKNSPSLLPQEKYLSGALKGLATLYREGYIAGGAEFQSTMVNRMQNYVDMVEYRVPDWVMHSWAGAVIRSSFCRTASANAAR